MSLILNDLFICGKAAGRLRTVPPLENTPMTATDGARPAIPGTLVFDGELARRGYALNKMCYSFNERANRDAFVADPESYMRRYGLSEPQAEAIRSKQVLALLAAGGNAYYLAKFAGIFGLDMQDIGAQQTGLSKDEFKARLVAANQQ
jgi:protocatechuate 4,5-dioxygenase alpha chain